MPLKFTSITYYNVQKLFFIDLVIY